MKINVYNQQKDLPIDKKSVRNAALAVAAHLKMDWEEVNVYFVTGRRIGALHGEFFDDPTTTDCITFPIDEKSGEIFICPATAIAYAKKNDPYIETTLYLVHGMLHLAGFDDLEEAARRTMRKKEKSCMRHLNTLGLVIRPKI